MAEEVFMNIPEVEKIQQAFGTMGDTLQQINQILNIAITLLKATAFFGLVGNFAAILFAEKIQKVVQQLQQLAQTFGEGVKGAIVSYRDGDSSGSQLFV